MLLLLFAILRLAPMALALDAFPMQWGHWAALVFSVVYMAYAEGYKGFHLGFAPRLVLRARYLLSNPRPDLILFAPLFCMGYIHATRRRQFLSIGLTVMIIGFILVVRNLPQPWRGILDAGVVVGLALGVTSIVYFMVLLRFAPDRIQVAAEVPVDPQGETGAWGSNS